MSDEARDRGKAVAGDAAALLEAVAGVGFMVIVYGGGERTGAEGWMHYASNTDQRGNAALLREVLRQLEKP